MLRRKRLIGISGVFLVVLLASISACSLPDLTGGGNAAQGPAPSKGQAATVGISTPTSPPVPVNTAPKPTTVFMIVMENHNWSDIKGNPNAPYINTALLPMASYTQQYYSPGVSPSEPNYLWLEAGTNFGVSDDALPADNHQSSNMHLVSLLRQANISWKSYQEGIDGTHCPLNSRGLYAPRHNPMVYFDDVTNSNDPNSAYCISHVRPYSELSRDLQTQNVARYNFITPNLCDDMHNSCEPANDPVAQGDSWLAHQIPLIMASQAYRDGGIIFITWDDGENGGPIGMIVLSPYARGNGYSNSIHYTHSSTLRTLEEIFNVQPMLGDAANSNDLSDLFRVFPRG